jgi:WD40 repeat protein
MARVPMSTGLREFQSPTTTGPFGLRIATLLLLAVSLAAAGADRRESITAKPTRLDRYGDPLPADALARMGSTRFRHGSWVYRVLFSRDGKTIISAGADRMIRFWEASSGKQVRQLSGHTSAIHSLTLSPDGKTLASAGTDETIRLWDVTSGKEIRRIQAPIGRIAALAFAPDGKTLASGSSDNSIRLWDPANGQIVRQWAAHNGEVSSLVFAANGKTLASGGWDKTAGLWEAATGRELRRFRIEGAKAGNGGLGVALSPDGKTLVTGGLGLPTLRLWDTGTGKEVHQLKGKWGFLTVTFSPDGKILLSGGQDGSLRLWDVASGKERHRFQDSGGWMLSVAFSPDGQSVAGADGRCVRSWETATGKNLAPAPGLLQMVDSITLSPDGKFLASASHNDPHSLRLWETVTGREIRVFADPGGSRFAVFSADGKWLASAGFGGTTCIWETAAGKQRYCLDAQEIVTHAVVFAADGKTLLSAGSAPAIRRWDLSTGKSLPPLGSHAGGVKALALSPGGKVLASGGWDKTIRLWDATTDKPLHTLRGQQGSVWSVAFSPDGALLASASCKNAFTASAGEDRMIRLWDVAAGKEIRHFGGHAGGYYQVAFAPDGRTLASAGEDGQVRIWEVYSGLERHPFSGHRGPVSSVVFSTDGKVLASGSSDTTILIWDVAGRLHAGRSQPARLAAKDLEKLWSDLAENDGAKVDRAIQELTAAPREAVPYLQARLPQPPADPRRIPRLIADLDSEQFDLREKATRELEKLDLLAEPLLRKALDGQPSLEVRRRVESLLEKVEPSKSPSYLRLLRAIEVLEHSGTSKAREVLVTFAARAPGSLLSREAKAALERMKR